MAGGRIRFTKAENFAPLPQIQFKTQRRTGADISSRQAKHNAEIHFQMMGLQRSMRPSETFFRYQFN
ncbi:hypothetical protein BV913_09545 [Neisseria dumasiana]|uniref:Uncharacterized protein n=1 Tax=Neisseria dumasiana TaxID=1931275 RepID=A0ABX3WL23_9NEIS|nr:hypothetical protein BV913_09545 [Neisseria dumasiana]